jgi:hypothetical protein
MADKTDDTKRNTERNAEIFTEYQTLLSQSQDELSIVKALSAKYSLDQVALGEIVAEGRKNPPKAPAQPAQSQQMGTAPPKGTVQSGKEPKAD